MRILSYVTPHLITPSTGTPSLSSTLSSSHVLNPPLSEHKPCGDPRPPLSGALAEHRPFTGYEPRQLAENQDHKHFTEDKQFNPLSSHQPITASTYDSAESIATPPPDSDFDDEQLRALLASPLYLQEREANAERSQAYHSERDNLMSSASHDSIGTGKLVALFSSKHWLNRETFSDREDFPSRHQQVFGSNEPFLRFSIPANSAKSLPDGNRDHLLAEARSELMKQEKKVESLSTCISELQRLPISDMKNLEESDFDYKKKPVMKGKTNFEILRFQVFLKWKN